MNVELILKVAGVGFLVTVVFQVLSKSGRDYQGMLGAVAGIIIVLLMIVGELGGLLDTIKNVFGL